MKKTLAILLIFLLFLNINPVQIALAGNKPNNSSGLFEESTFFIYYGSTFYVGGLGPGNYTNIQSAIDAASSGDNIFVYNGTYFENVNIGKSIKLQGQDMKSTIIDGEGNHNAVNIISDGVTLSGFTINNSEVGIVLDSSSNTKINANTILNMDVGIWLYDSSHNKITNNSINNNLVGIELLSSSDYNVITDNNIQYNAFGLMLYTASYNTIKKNTIKQNDESGIWLNYSSNNNKIANNIIEDNKIGIDIFTSLYR
jgi:parallel beta-helix repeat protein